MVETKNIGDVVQFRLARTVLGKDLYYTAAYLVDGLLIDTGPYHVAAEFYETASELGVEQIVNTHHHEDHIGSNHLFEGRMGLVASAHPRAVPRIQQPPRWLPLYRQIIWGAPRPAHAVPIGDEVQTPQHRLRVLYTPGHADDHICLYDADEGHLFSGDLYLAVKVGVVRTAEDIPALMTSLRTVGRLPVSILFGGGTEIVNNANEQLQLKLEFLEELMAQVHKLHRAGLQEKQIRNRLLGHEGSIWAISLGEFAKLNLVRALLRTPERERAESGTREPQAS
jgi:glyoxylase-like metal-dependent hydrolase (beta-lactamase superfamily II)